MLLKIVLNYKKISTCFLELKFIIILALILVCKLKIQIYLGDHMKKIAILAANGKAGQAIVYEALSRGFNISAFIRNGLKQQFKDDIKIVQKDIFSLNSENLEGFDYIIDAFGEWGDLNLHKKHIEHLCKILHNNRAKLVIVGGAGSLYMDKNHSTMLIDMPNFPNKYKPLGKAMAEGLEFLRSENKINWLYVSPPADFITDAPKSGKYKIISEEFEVNDKGESKGSYKDYAAALLDAMLNYKLNRTRIGVIGL